MFTWTTESVEWYVRAERENYFHRNIADHLKEFISSEESLLDVGCGPGCVDFALSPFVKNILCVDIEPIVIAEVNKQIQQSKCKNISALCCDWKTLKHDRCDVLLVCSFGKFKEDLENFLHLCRKKILYVRRSQKVFKEGFASEYYVKNDVQMEEIYAREYGLDVTSRYFILESGQPFQNIQEAVRFTEYYRLAPPGQTAVQYLDRHLKVRNCGKYPLYLPNKKEMFLLCAEKRSGGNKKWI